MAKILVADPLAEDGLERLRQAGEVTVVSKLAEAELIRRIPEFDALVVRSETRVTAPVIEAGTKLRVVGRAGVGVDNIDVSAATRKGILVVNAPRGNIIAAAEHTIALLFSLARWVPQADASVKRGEWSRAKFIGTEIRGKTLGVIGLGNVGSEVAKRAHGLEMDVIAYDPVVAVERVREAEVSLFVHRTLPFAIEAELDVLGQRRGRRREQLDAARPEVFPVVPAEQQARERVPDAERPRARVRGREPVVAREAPLRRPGRETSRRRSTPLRRCTRRQAAARPCRAL